MKKTLFCAGLTLVGAAGLQSAFAAEVDTVSPRAWNVSASLRGFYDDNYNISGTTKGSFGTELTPQVSINLPMQQTDLGMRYKYSLNYFQDRDSLLGFDKSYDQTHQVDVWLDHAFNTRWKLNLNDSFASGQEPELLNPVGLASTPFRVNGDNIANHANATLNTEWSRLFSTKVAYGNAVYAYDDSGQTLANIIALKGPSRAGELNRVEQTASIDFQWTVQPETMGFVGYRLNWVNFTGNEPITYTVLNPVGPVTITHYSADNDNRTHSGYVGVQHEFTETLSGKAQGGVSYTDHYNDPFYSSDSLSPYADLSLTYTYLPGSYLQMGFTHDINQTDVKNADSMGRLTEYQESSRVYASINHRFTPKLVGSVIGNAQFSDYKGGQYSASTDCDYNLGVNLAYEINRYFSVETGYNYDDLVSDIAGRSFSRNRVYLGLTASY